MQRAEVEATVGHIRSEHRFKPNGLERVVGDAVLSAGAMNFEKLQGFSWRFFQPLLVWLQQAIDYEANASIA
jgi:hypothetical protein